MASTFDFRLLGLEHLLGTTLLAGLTIYLSIRMPESRADWPLRVALIVELLAALAAIPLFFAAPSKAIIRLALAAFCAAGAAFIVFGWQTIRARVAAIHERRKHLL